MKQDTIQTSFATGEIAPELYGRVDIAQYANACGIVENWLVRPYGSVISTPGTEFINACKTGGSTGIVRVIPFIFSRTDAYVLEVGVEYFRFYTAGAVVVSPGTTPYEVVHTYTETQLMNIHYRQLNDVIWLMHGDHPIGRLIRSSSTSWALEDYEVLGGPFLDDNTDEDYKLNPSGTDGTISITAAPTNETTFVVSGATLGHKNTYWKIGGITTDETTGADVQGYVKLTNIVNAYSATGTVMKILSSAAATHVWAKPAWCDVTGYPARGMFHGQRFYTARTDTQPNDIWGSKPFQYDDMAVNSGADGDAIDIEVASAESNDFKWLASAKALLAGSYGGDIAVGAGLRAPLTPANTNVSDETGWGSEAIQPKKIGNYVYYVQRFGKKLREMFYLWDQDSYKSKDQTILAPHIAGEGGFKEIMYQANPDSVLWCTRSDGTLATLTREIDQELAGWSRQTTLGTYESIAIIPSATEDHDEVWVVVNRNIDGSNVRYIERFKSQIIPDRKDKCWYVHSGLSYDAYNSYTTTTISLSGTAGTSVIVTSSAAHFASNDIGQRIRCIDVDGATVGQLKISNYTSSTVVSGNVEYTFDASAYVANIWGLSVDTISGLDHLEAETVSVLADGGLDKPNKVVSNGTITLAYNYFVVTAGLPYTGILETLPQEKATQRGTAQGKKQRINEISFKVNRSHTGFKVGGTSALAERVVFRDPTWQMGTPPPLFTGIIPNILFRGGYVYGAKVRIENPDPLPIEMLSIQTSLDTQEK